MQLRTTPVLIWILHAEDKEIEHLPEVTRLDIMDGASLDPHPEGLFSTTIFGNFGNELRDKLYGKIDLRVRILHPKLYKDLMSLKQLYREILQGTTYAVFDKQLKDFVRADGINETGETGFSFFFRHLDDLKLEHNDSFARTEKIKTLEKWWHRKTMKNLVVMPAGLRDIEIGTDGRITKNEVNDFYYRILAAASMITRSDDMEDPVYNNVRRNLQNAVNDLYEYLDNFVGGKNGFEREKFLSRRVMDGTRNVITAMDATGKSLLSDNVPGFDSTVLGLYQASRSLAPKMLHWLQEGPLGRLNSIGDNLVPLINKKTLKQEYVRIDHDVIDELISERGMMELIHRQTDVEARHRPIEVDGYYLALVYQDNESFKIVYDIDEIPDIFNKLIKEKKAFLEPITLEELIYYAGYNKFKHHYNVSTRYPGTDDNSTYPTTIYVKTTTTGSPLFERDYDWKYDDKDKSTFAAEWPMRGVTTYHDSHSPHSGRLAHSAAD